MPIAEFCMSLQEKLSASLPENLLETAAQEVGGYFGVRSHEVALFRVDHRQHRIVFRWPKSLANSGHIPLRGVDSLVARTVREQVGVVDNGFAASRHLYMYEHLLADRAERISVQKVMSVPVVVDGTVLAVIQIGRKGATPDEAGPDFTTDDLASLKRIAGVLASYPL